MKQHECGLMVPDSMDAPGSYLKRSVICGIALGFCAERRVVIQAGGHIGIWPRVLAQHFDKVITIEPERANLECLRENIKPFTNIELHEGVLGAYRGKAKLNYRPPGKGTGGHHIATRLDLPWIEVEQYTLNGIAVSQTQLVDLIMLDIEGYEFFALQGGLEYIRRRRPVIVIEENSCARMHGLEDSAARELLEREGYKTVETYDVDRVMVAA